LEPVAVRVAFTVLAALLVCPARTRAWIAYLYADLGPQPRLAPSLVDRM
jgi:hypothetical protein